MIPVSMSDKNSVAEIHARSSSFEEKGHQLEQRHPTLPIAKPKPFSHSAQYNSNKLTVFDGRHRQLDGFLVDRVQRQIYQQPKALE